MLFLILVAMEVDKVFEIVKGSGDSGRTITEIVKISKLPRSVVRILLARLEGAESVGFRRVGMAKVYSMGGRK